MKHVFGPVPSRRLGRSLGIDPVPLKTCNFSCIYCQLGRTRRLARKRRTFFSVSSMVAEVATALGRHAPDSIDWITFVGSGETGLFSRLGSLIRFVKSISRLPVAVITNGSLLYLPGVREEFLVADAVLPNLDAGTDRLFRRINRPHPDYPFDRHVEGLIQFREIYQGNLWVEIMLVDGVNDTTEALFDIGGVLERIRPDGIHISTPIRPPAELWVNPPSDEGLQRAASILGGVAPVLRPLEADLVSGLNGEITDAVLNIVSRHPMQEFELIGVLARWPPRCVFDALGALSEAGNIRAIERHGKRFWCAAEIEFPDLRA